MPFWDRMIKWCKSEQSTLLLSAYYAFLPLIFTRGFPWARYLAPFYHQPRGLRSRETEQPASQLSAWPGCGADLVLPTPRSVLLNSAPRCLKIRIFVCFIVESGGQPSMKTLSPASQPWDPLKSRHKDAGIRPRAGHPPILAHKCHSASTGTQEKLERGDPARWPQGELLWASLGPQATSLLAIYLLVLSKTHGRANSPGISYEHTGFTTLFLLEGFWIHLYGSCKC